MGGVPGEVPATMGNCLDNQRLKGPQVSLVNVWLVMRIGVDDMKALGYRMEAKEVAGSRNEVQWGKGSAGREWPGVRIVGKSWCLPEYRQTVWGAKRCMPRYLTRIAARIIRSRGPILRIRGTVIK